MFDAFSWRTGIHPPDQVRGHASLENAIDPFTFIKSNPTPPENRCFSGVLTVGGPKKPFFSVTNGNVYFRLTHVRFFSETAVRNQHVSHL